MALPVAPDARALAAAWITLMAASYYAGLHEANEITEAHLASAVNVLLQISTFGAQAADPSRMKIPVEEALQSYIPLGRHLNLARSLAVLVWDHDTRVVDSRPLDQRWKVLVPDGYSTLLQPSGAGAAGAHQWRIFAAQRTHNTRRAAIIIDLEQRARIGRQVAFTIARPALVVLPLVALLLWWALRRGLRPLTALSTRVDLQGGERLEDAHRFAEFASLVEPINGLIDRLQSQANRDREFASDVAHELRTPLAAIALQSNVAAALTDPTGRVKALATLKYEALRAGQILGQLLDMARAQRFGDGAMQDGALGELAARDMAGFTHSSHDSGHVLELVDGPAAVTVRGNPLLLEPALCDLIANGIGHAGAGTLVRDAGEPPMTTRFSLQWRSDAITS
jgi:two-component system sensor histidine kinase QseC